MRRELNLVRAEVKLLKQFACMPVSEDSVRREIIRCIHVVGL
jgi:hypothetical protein